MHGGRAGIPLLNLNQHLELLSLCVGAAAAKENRARAVVSEHSDGDVDSGAVVAREGVVPDVNLSGRERK